LKILKDGAYNEYAGNRIFLSNHQEEWRISMQDNLVVTEVKEVVVDDETFKALVALILRYPLSKVYRCFKYIEKFGTR